tara:strand:+ start:78 stop:707 length:630 start_codon:yes stop_codon:yes gene_type:complete
MTISKIQAESINLSDTFAFTGTVTGAGDEAKILSFGSYNSGYGSGARLVTSSTSWVNMEINGTDQAVFGQITKNTDDSLNYNKTSNSSHLIISINFPSYNAGGNNGHGVRCRFEATQGSNTYNTLDIISEGPAHGWGMHGYGGNHAAMNNFTWSTYDNSSYRNTIKTSTGNMRFYFDVKVWSSSDTVYFIDYSDTYPKYCTIQVYEVAA